VLFFSLCSGFLRQSSQHQPCCCFPCAPERVQERYGMQSRTVLEKITTTICQSLALYWDDRHPLWAASISHSAINGSATMRCRGLNRGFACYVTNQLDVREQSLPYTTGLQQPPPLTSPRSHVSASFQRLGQIRRWHYRLRQVVRRTRPSPAWPCTVQPIIPAPTSSSRTRILCPEHTVVVCAPCSTTIPQARQPDPVNPPSPMKNKTKIQPSFTTIYPSNKF
jgi:hypothetical protein